MSTLFVKFPPHAQADAIAYNDECTVHNPDVGATWGNVRVDRNGNWTVPLLGPPWSYDGVNTVPEPPSCAALRVDAVVVEASEWPIEED